MNRRNSSIRASSFLGRHLAIVLRQEPRVGALLDGHQIHVFQLARVRARPHLAQAPRRADPSAAASARRASSHVRSARTSTPSISLPPRPTCPPEIRQIVAASTAASASSPRPRAAPAVPRRVCGGKSGMCTSSRPCRFRSTSSRSGRDVANTQMMRPAVARVGHFLREHRVDAARQPAVAVRRLPLAGHLIGFVDEHHDLADARGARRRSSPGSTRSRRPSDPGSS